jgi:hypothetical protein
MFSICQEYSSEDLIDESDIRYLIENTVHFIPNLAMPNSMNYIHPKNVWWIVSSELHRAGTGWSLVELELVSVMNSEVELISKHGLRWS